MCIVSVRDFGAIGDGDHDDGPAIQSAIDHVLATRGELYFPPNRLGKSYRIGAPLRIGGPISIRGEGAMAVEILATGLAAGQYVMDFYRSARVEHVRLSGFTLRSDNGLPSALHLDGAVMLSARDLRYYNVHHGCVLEGAEAIGTYSHHYDSINATGITGSTVLFAAGFKGGGNFSFASCTFAGALGLAIMPTVITDGVILTGCNFEGCETNSLYVGGSCRGLTLTGCRTEAAPASDLRIAPAAGEKVEGIAITGCTFTGKGGASTPITLGGGGGTVRGFSITGNQVEYAGMGGAFVQLDGEGQSGLIAGNRFAQADTKPTSVLRPGVVQFANENGLGRSEEYWGEALWGVEEGAFTPVDASGAGLTLSGAGRYTRIGRTLSWQAFVQYPDTTSAAPCAIGGLPFAVSQGLLNLGRAGAGCSASNSGLALGVLQGMSAPTYLDLVNPATGAAIANTAMAGRYAYISGTYMI